MNMVLYRPDTDITSLTRSMDRLLRESLIWPIYRPFTFLDEDGYGFMPLDIRETDTHVIVEASLPGVKVEDVDITLSDRALTIKAETKKEEETKEDDYVCRESFSGKLSRSINLNEGLDVDKAEADMENGVLTLRIPKLEVSKAKSIKVKVHKQN